MVSEIWELIAHSRHKMMLQVHWTKNKIHHQLVVREQWSKAATSGHM